MARLGQPGNGDPDDEDADRHVDQERGRHEMTVSAPPSTSPSTDPDACMAADTANAWLRAWPTA